MSFYTCLGNHLWGREIIMQKPCIPENEERRLAEVYNLNILDSPREVYFENITRILQNIFDVDIVAISIIDSDRQWFKAIRGANLKETPRELSLCAHAILDKNLFIINDTLQDERFHDHPLVTGDPKIRFYAGCPLFTKNGLGIGSLCLINKAPREIDAMQQSILSDFGRFVEDLLNDSVLKSNNKAINKQLEVIKKDFTDEQNMLLSRESFINYFNHLRHINSNNYHNNTLSKYSNFYLAIVEITNIQSVNNIKDSKFKNIVLETIIDQIIKNLSGSDIIANYDKDKYLLVIDNVGPNRLNKTFNNIVSDVRNIDLNQYGFDYKFEVSIGWSYFQQNRQQPITKMMQMASKQLQVSKQQHKNFIEA